MVLANEQGNKYYTVELDGNDIIINLNKSIFFVFITICLHYDNIYI